MDPNTALENILRGHNMFDHVEALHDWIKGGGFFPESLALPQDCSACFRRLPRNQSLKVSYAGLIREARKGEWLIVMTWPELQCAAKRHDAAAAKKAR